MLQEGLGTQTFDPDMAWLILVTLFPRLFPPNALDHRMPRNQIPDCRLDLRLNNLR